jgi:hypothetical protein
MKKMHKHDALIELDYRAVSIGRKRFLVTPSPNAPGSYYLSTWLTQGFEKDDGGWGTIILT